MRRLYHLELAKSDGGAVAITLLRPAEWLDQLDRNANGQVLLTLPELDAVGYAQVVSVDPCPAIASGPGRVVLGTFHHSAGDVYDVRLSDGSQLGVTARHPVWSVDRGEWVSVGDLEPGETLETLDGPVQFESATPRAEAAPVFNLEIDADHAYRVGEHGVLVHNESPSPCGPREPETVCHYGECGLPNLHVGTWVTDSCGLPWDRAISITTGLVDIKKKGTKVCEYKFDNLGVLWKDRPVNGLRQGTTETAVYKFSSTRLIPPWE